MTELRKVCAYPALLNDFSSVAAAATAEESEAAGPAEHDDAAVPPKPEERVVKPSAAAGKLALLAQLLPALRAGDHHVLLFSQARKVCAAILQRPHFVPLLGSFGSHWCVTD